MIAGALRSSAIPAARTTRARCALALPPRFDRFVDIGKMPHRQAAELIHADAVDILIDLKGFTPASAGPRSSPTGRRRSRSTISAIPARWGRILSTTSSSTRLSCRSDQQSFYSEKLVHLADCYQCNDDKREIAEQTPSRPNAACRSTALSSAASTTPTRSPRLSSISGCDC